jgi:hypothetical protein
VAHDAYDGVEQIVDSMSSFEDIIFETDSRKARSWQLVMSHCRSITIVGDRCYTSGSAPNESKRVLESISRSDSMLVDKMGFENLPDSRKAMQH